MSRASEVIEKLKSLMEKHGNLPVYSYDEHYAFCQLDTSTIEHCTPKEAMDRFGDPLECDCFLI